MVLAQDYSLVPDSRPDLLRSLVPAYNLVGPRLMPGSAEVSLPAPVELAVSEQWYSLVFMNRPAGLAYLAKHHM